MKANCIFCKIGSAQVPSEFVYRDDKMFVIRDIDPKAPTHLLIIPFQHTASLAYVAPSNESTCGHMFAVAEEVARREGVTKTGYRLVVNQGPDSGQEISHLHMHVLGGRQLSAMG